MERNKCNHIIHYAYLAWRTFSCRAILNVHYCVMCMYIYMPYLFGKQMRSRVRAPTKRTITNNNYAHNQYIIHVSYMQCNRSRLPQTKYYYCSVYIFALAPHHCCVLCVVCHVNKIYAAQNRREARGIMLGTR